MAGVRFDSIFKQIGEGGMMSTDLHSGASLVQSELNFLLTTKKHTLFFGNDLGMDLERYLHLLNTEATFNLIKDELELLFQKYGKVYLQRIDMEVTQNTKGININIIASMDPQGMNEINIPLRLED